MSVFYSFLVFLTAVTIAASYSEQASYCASLFTEKYFQGIRFNISSESRWDFTAHLNIRPHSVRLASKGNCALTLFDRRGNIQIIRKDSSQLNWPHRHPLRLTCCQCGGCDVMKRHPEIECARIYQYEQCSNCMGSSVTIKNNQEVTDFQVINHRLASVSLRDGCKLEAFFKVKTANLQFGFKLNLNNGNNYIDSQELFNTNATVLIEKVSCTCSMSGGNTANDFGGMESVYIKRLRPGSIETTSNEDDLDFSISSENNFENSTEEKSTQSKNNANSFLIY